MCGISGSSSLESGFELYSQNLDRGYYSSSVTVIYPTGHMTLKRLGKFEVTDIPRFGAYYLFHSRGPTVETKEFAWDDNHPFTYGRYMVAHNGIIENYEDISKLLTGKTGSYSVDSKVVPALIDRTDDVSPQNLIQALNRLKGTFGLWILDTRTWKIYLARHDITLFNYGLEFSSSNPSYMREVPQNTLFEINTSTARLCEVGSLTPTAKPKYFIPPK